MSAAVEGPNIRLVTGRATFTDDYGPPGLLHARVLRSPHPHARILAIDRSGAVGLRGVAAVLSHEDVPRKLHSRGGPGGHEGPRDAFILDDTVRYRGDRIAVVAAEDPDVAERACRAIEVTYEVLPALLDPEDAERADAPRIHGGPDHQGPPNVAGTFEVEEGDLRRGLSEADRVFEGTYRIPSSGPHSLEPYVTLAFLDENGRLVIRTSNESPFHLRHTLAGLLEMSVGRIRVLTPRVGGGFGAKQEIRDEDLAALLALQTGRPVRLRSERDIERSAERVSVRTGVRNGLLTAFDVKVLVDAGAYGGRAGGVLDGEGSHLLSLYACPHKRFEARAVYTNNAPAGGFRGKGWPQGSFAIESHMDDVAFGLGEDPLEFRKKNSADGEGRNKLLQLGGRAVGWAKRRTANKRARGLGVALGVSASPGWKGDHASASLRMNEDGSFLLLVGGVDSQGDSEEALRALASESLGCDSQSIVLLGGDTDLPPVDSGGHASSTTAHVGAAVLDASRRVRKEILDVAGRLLGAPPESLTARQGRVVAKVGTSVSFGEVAEAAAPQGPIQATATHALQSPASGVAATFADVDVDLETGVVQLVKLVTVVDCGTIVQEGHLRSHVEGATLRGVLTAFSLSRIAAKDAPELQCLLLAGEGGPKAIGAVVSDPVAPAIANAIAQAVGTRLRELPLSPERVLQAISRGRG